MPCLLPSCILLFVTKESVQNAVCAYLHYYQAEPYTYVSQVFITALDLVTKVYDDLDEDQDMITPLQFGQLLIDWTDSSKAVSL